MPGPRDYDDIPGTFVFDGRRSRRGAPLNRFLMSLNEPANRDAFKADEPGYLNRFGLDDEQREAVLERRWLRLLEVGGNIYYTYKLAACDGMTFQDLAGEQTGMTRDQFAAMMRAGGRPIHGNRRASEWSAAAGRARTEAGADPADGAGPAQAGAVGDRVDDAGPPRRVAGGPQSEAQEGR